VLLLNLHTDGTSSQPPSVYNGEHTITSVILPENTWGRTHWNSLALEN